MTENGRAGNPNGMKWISHARRLAIYLRDEFRCVYCCADLHHARAGAISLDHIVPRAEGGDNNTLNLITACLACNVARSTMTHSELDPEVMERIGAWTSRGINLAAARAIIGASSSFLEVLSRHTGAPRTLPGRKRQRARG